MRLARELAGMTQDDLAQRIGVSQTAIFNLEKRDSESSRNSGGLAHALGVRLEWLLYGEEPMKNVDYAVKDVQQMRPGVADRNAEDTEYVMVEAESDDWDKDEFCYLDKLNVSVRGGHGEAGCIEVVDKKLPMMRSTLRAAGVPVECAKIVQIVGRSMYPLLDDGDVIGVNIADKWPVKDGMVYAFRDVDMLRVKYLERVPGGGLRVKSENSAEYPPEVLSRDEVEARIEIIGRMFWRSGIHY